MLNLYAVTLSG